MEQLNLYLSKIIPTEEQEIKDSCCDIENNVILTENLLWTCIKCGKIKNDMVEHKDDYEQYKNPLIVKTFIGYNGNNKYSGIRRLNKWSTWQYDENELHKMKTYINNLDLKHKDELNIKRIANIKLKEFYIDNKVKTRNNIRRALFVYCIIFACNYIKVDYKLKYLMKIANITPKHYKSILIKLEKMELI